MCYIQLGWVVVIITFVSMILAYLTGAQQIIGDQTSYINKYSFGSSLLQNQPRFANLPQSHHFSHLKEDYPFCNFNTQCICSNTGPDLGLVFCDDVELGSVPSYLNNTKIHTLTLRNNQLRHIGDYAFYGTGMFRLEIRHNLLFYLAEKALLGIERSIWQLDLQYNLLSSIPSKALRKLKKLSHLDLTGNQISDIKKEDFSGLEASLKTLVLAQNSIVNLPDGVFQKLQLVRTIDLQGNNILFVSDRAFHGSSSSLIHLNFANNLLTSIPFEALSEVHNLQTLNFARNRISKTFKVLFNGFLTLDTLLLDMNEIKSLPPYSFQNFGNVNKTSLRGNPLNDISNDAFRDAKIKELYLHDCNINFISETAFRGLETTLQLLDISYNNLSSLPDKIFVELGSVRSLSLAYNNLHLNPKMSFNVFKYTLQHLNLLGEKMGKFPIGTLKDIRNVRTLGLSTLPNTDISKKDFMGFGPAVEKLFLKSNGITSINSKAFEHVPGVKILDLSFNTIGFIDNEAFVNIGGSLEKLVMKSALLMATMPTQTMMYLTNLRELDLSNNNLNYIDSDCFRYMSNLRKLNLQDNKIRQLYKNHFQGQFHFYLDYIKLSYNSLTTLETQTFHDYKNLHSIYLNDNMITTIGKFAFLNLENLQFLYLQGNNIKSLSLESFQNLPKLRLLDLSFNEMSNLYLDAFEQIGTLSTLTIDVSYNKISFLKLNGSMWSSYSGIKTLIFNHNNISVISPSYFESVKSSIKHMWFEYNCMKNISEEIFENMPHLSLLSFKHNLIESVSPRAFKGTSSLQYINFCGNNISDMPMNIFLGQVNLRHVDISHNSFGKISGELFKDSPLEILYASYNKIKKFPDFSVHKSSETLRVINLAHNEISDLKPTVLNRFQNLVSLDISHNLIKTIQSSAFFSLRKLVSLNLSGNFISRLQTSIFDGLEESLQDLNLSNTSLKTFPELKFSSLRYMNMSSNRLSYLSPTTIANYSSLRLLDLSDNELATTSSTVWPNLPRLRFLSLKNNVITLLTNDSFLGLQRLEQLDVKQLPIKNLQSGTFYSLGMLRELSITLRPQVFNFNLGSTLSGISSLQNLILEVDGELSQQLQGFSLPYKLSNIMLTGQRFSVMSNNALQMLRSRDLRLSIHETNLKSISEIFFRNLGNVRFVAFSALNNSLQRMGDPSSTSFPGEPHSVFLSDLRINGKNWKCDCTIGWIEHWMKLWRTSACEGMLASSVCEDTLRSLRKVQCSDRKKSIMEALKSDLECRSTSAGTNSLSESNFYHGIGFISLTFFFF